MPRSQNRRTIEVPVQLYDELKAEAEREGATISVVLQRLIAEGRGAHEHYEQLADEVREVKSEAGHIAQLAEQQATMVQQFEPVLKAFERQATIAEQIGSLSRVAEQIGSLSRVAEQIGSLSRVAEQIGAASRIAEQVAPMVKFVEQFDQTPMGQIMKATQTWESPIIKLVEQFEQTPAGQAMKLAHNPTFQAALGSPALQLAQRIQEVSAVGQAAQSMQDNPAMQLAERTRRQAALLQDEGRTEGGRSIMNTEAGDELNVDRGDEQQ